MLSGGRDNSEFLRMDESSINEARRKIGNLILSHEIVFNDKFRISPSERAWKSMQEDVDRVLECVRKELNDHSSDYSVTIALIHKIKGMIRELVFPNKPTLVSLTEGCFDENEVIAQLRSNTLDWDAFICRIVSCLSIMCSEARDSEIADLRRMPDIIDQLRALIFLLKHMHLDIANFLILSYRHVFRVNWKNYCRETFEYIAGEHEKQGYDALKNAKLWFAQTVQMTGTDDCMPSSQQFYTQVVNLSFIRFLYPQENPPFPETTEIDLTQFLKIRFALMRHFLLQCLKLISSQVLFWNDGIEHEVKILLQDLSLTTDIKALLSSISTQILSKFPTTAETTKTKFIKLVDDLHLLEKHAVYNVLFKRFTTAMKTMLEMEYEDGIKYATKNIDSDLKDYATQFYTLVKVNVFIFDDIYRNIIFTMTHKQSQSK